MGRVSGMGRGLGGRVMGGGGWRRWIDGTRGFDTVVFGPRGLKEIGLPPDLVLVKVFYVALDVAADRTLH